MKKLYFFSFALLAAAGSAQTTLTSAAMPQAGYVYSFASDTAASDLPTFTVSAGSASAQTWNYTTEFANVYGESTSFVAPSSGAGASNFPGATLAAAQPNGTDWVYFEGNTNGFYVDGVYMNFQGSMAAIDFSPNALVMATPSTYGYNNNTVSYATTTLTVSGATYQLRHKGDRTVTADAFGSLTTPTGTYPNTLRVKTYDVNTDSVFIDVFGSWSFFTMFADSGTTYTWYQNTPDAQLMEIELDGNNVVTKAKYLQSFSNGVAQVEKAEAKLSVYPNPVSEGARLTYENKSPGTVTLQMFDMNGRLVADLLKQDQSAGSQHIYLNTSVLRLPQGMYFLRLRNSEGIQTIKVSIH